MFLTRPPLVLKLKNHWNKSKFLDQRPPTTFYLKLKKNLRPQLDVTVSSRRQQPRLEWMPLQTHYTEIVVGGVPLELLHGNNEGVLQKVGVHHAVAYRDIPIVSGWGEERIPLVVLDSSNCVCVIAKSLVRHTRQVQVEPLNLLVEGSKEKIVATRMDRHGRYPFSTRHQFLWQLLRKTINYKVKNLPVII